MKYSALVGVVSGNLGEGKAEKDEYQIRLMHELLKRWNSRITVAPYYDRSIDPDAMYMRLIKQAGVVADLRRKNKNIDSPLDVLNFFGQRQGYIYYSEVPADDDAQRRYMRSKYEKMKKQAEESGEKIDPEVVEEFEYLIEEPVPGEKTGVYAYSVINPHGYFSEYCFPIKTAFNGISVETSRLVNKNFGNYGDIMLLGDLDFETTMLPEVVFRNDGRVLESDDPEEIEQFLRETLSSTDYVAIIECEA